MYWKQLICTSNGLALAELRLVSLEGEGQAVWGCAWAWIVRSRAVLIVKYNLFFIMKSCRALFNLLSQLCTRIRFIYDLSRIIDTVKYAIIYDLSRIIDAVDSHMMRRVSLVCMIKCFGIFVVIFYLVKWTRIFKQILLTRNCLIYLYIYSIVHTCVIAAPLLL